MYYVAGAENGLPVALCGPFEDEATADLFCETAINPALVDEGYQFATVWLVTPEELVLSFDEGVLDAQAQERAERRAGC